MSFGTFGSTSIPQRTSAEVAAEIERSIAGFGGEDAPEAGQVAGLLREQEKARGPLLNQARPAPDIPIAGVDVAGGVVVSAWGKVPLDPLALSMIVSIAATAVRDHVANQLAGINSMLGLPDTSAQAQVASRALRTLAAAPGAPAKPELPKQAKGRPRKASQNGRAEGAELQLELDV